MKSKSLFIAGIVLLIGFGLFIGGSVYSNMRLQRYFKTLTQASYLLITWHQVEISTRELFATYDLSDVSHRWKDVIEQFNHDFKEFLRSPIITSIGERDTDFAVEVAMIDMYWGVISESLLNAEKNIDNYITYNRHHLNSGNLLVDFGENWATGNYSGQLVDTIGALRACVSMSHASFTKALTKLSRHSTHKIQVQTKRMNFIAMMLSALLIVTGGIFIMFRMRTLTRSRELLRSFTDGLQIEIKEREHTTELFRAECDKLQGVLNAIGGGMYIVDNKYDIQYQNDIMAGDFGSEIDEKCFRKYGDFKEPCNFCLAHQSIENRKIQIAEAVLDDGKNWEVTYSPYVDVDGTFKTIVLWSDITEKKKIEAEVALSGHLASLGELSAGVAHEINNPINGIINYAERLEPFSGRLSSAGDIPSRIIKEGERIAGIVSNLLSFASHREETLRPVRLSEVLADTLSLVERQIEKDGISLDVNINNSSTLIMARGQEIKQVFLNLISNARYALNQHSKDADPLKKNLHISTELIIAESGRMARIRFQDNGCGIAGSVMEKICIPFFSTKPRGEGTGLGLSISHSIVKAHGGKISFESVESVYTVVSVDLPVSDSYR